MTRQTYEYTLPGAQYIYLCKASSVNTVDGQTVPPVLTTKARRMVSTPPASLEIQCPLVELAPTNQTVCLCDSRTQYLRFAICVM